MSFQLFKPTYTDKATGEPRPSPTWNIRFRDHLKRRQTLAAHQDEEKARRIGDRVMELVECRREGIGPPSKLRQWVDTRRESFRKRLIELDLIDATSIATDTPLFVCLDGRKDAGGDVVEPGWQQAIAARGTTPQHVARSVDRVRRILDGCDFIFWRDLVRPGAATDIEVFLGGLRTKGEIGGKTLNYYIRETKSFCRWLKESGRAPAVALESLKKVQNADVDSEARRALSVAEMRLLCEAAAGAGDLFGLTGGERALLYRFAFETGIRPGQIRALVVRDFDLDADPPTLTSTPGS